MAGCGQGKALTTYAESARTNTLRKVELRPPAGTVAFIPTGRSCFHSVDPRSRVERDKHIVQRIFIGIPVLNRFDLLRQCIEAVDYTAEVVVINNNGVDATFRSAVDSLSATNGFQVLHQKRNLGVSRSWNLLIREGFTRGYEWVFIGSNDTTLHPGSLKAAVDFPKDERFAVWHLHAFNFFLLCRRTIEMVGWFDENFYPAYKEDQDYAYRCRLAGLDRVAGITSCGADHVGSATIRSDPEISALVGHTGQLNAQYYLAKWGGHAGEELFTQPFNNPRYDHKWWPHPRSATRPNPRL